MDISEQDPTADVIGIGLPLLEMSLPVTKQYIEENQIILNECICAGQEHDHIFVKAEEDESVLFLPAGDVTTTLRVLQSLNEETSFSTALVGGVGKDETAERFIKFLKKIKTKRKNLKIQKRNIQNIFAFEKYFHFFFFSRLTNFLEMEGVRCLFYVSTRQRGIRSTEEKDVRTGTKVSLRRGKQRAEILRPGTFSTNL